MKRVGCDPHVMTSKAASLKRRPFSHIRANIEECHDAIEEDDTSSNTPLYKVSIENKLRHKQGFSICTCHPWAKAMLIFFVSIQIYLMSPLIICIIFFLLNGQMFDYFYLNYC